MAIPMILKGCSAGGITLTLPASGFDPSGYTLAVSFNGVTRLFDNLVAGGSVELSYTAEETASFPVGTARAFLMLTNAGGDVMSLPWVKFKVTDSRDEYAASSPTTTIDVDVRGALAEVAALPERWKDSDLRAKINEIIAKLGGGIVALIVAILPALGVTFDVQTAQKGDIYNDEQVVTNVTLDVSDLATKDYVDVAIQAAGSVTPEIVTNIVNDIAPTPGDYETVSNRAMNAVQPGSLSFTNNYIHISWADDKTSEFAGHANEASYADNAGTADSADYAYRAGDAEFAGYTQKVQFGANLSDAKTGEEMLALNKTYTDNATSNLARVSHTGSYNDLSNKPTIPADQSGYITGVSNRVEEVVSNIPSQILRVVSGTNIVLVCTNYNSATHLPSIRLEYLPADAEEYIPIWDLQDNLTNVLGKANKETALATNALASVKADRAWGKYTSGFGVDAPEGETWISSSNTVFAAGHDFAKTVTTGGEIFTLVSTGMLLTNVECPTNAAFFSIVANNEEIYRVEKTDSRVVDVNINAVNAVDPYLLIDCTGWMYPSHPLCRVRTDLQSGSWLKEEDYTNGLIPNVAEITWLGTGTVGDPYICQIENLTGGDRIFAGLWYEAPGQTKVIPQGVTDLTGGIWFDGNKYVPTVSGDELKFIRAN